MGDIKFQIIHLLVEMWRRRWSIMLVTWLVGLAGAYMAARVPDTYTSRATVFVDTQTLLNQFLPRGIPRRDAAAEVDNVRRLMYARPNLEEVIRRTDLDLTLRDRRDWESLVKRLEEQMTLVRQGQNFYVMEFSHRDPEKARSVVQALLDLFLEEGLTRGSGLNNAEGDKARGFLEEQRDEAQRRLSRTEAELAEYEREYRDELAGAPSVASEKRGLEAELQQLNSDRLLFEQEIASLRARIAAAPKEIITRYRQVTPEQGARTPPPSTSKRPVPRGPTLEEQRYQAALQGISALRGDLQNLLERLTPQHPDVIAARRRVENSEQELASLQAAAQRAQAELEAEIQSALSYNESVDRAFDEWRYQQTVSSAPTQEPVYGANPELAELRIQLDQRQNRLTVIERQVEQARENIRNLQSTLARQPEILQTYDKLRDDRRRYRTDLENAQEKIETLQLSQGANALNLVDFRVVEPPRAPVTPAGPNRILLFAAAAILALGAGFGLAFLRVQMCDNLPTVVHLKNSYDLNILGSVSKVEHGGNFMRSAAGNVALAVSFALFVSLFSYVAWRFQNELWRPDIAGLFGIA